MKVLLVSITVLLLTISPCKIVHANSSNITSYLSNSHGNLKLYGYRVSGQRLFVEIIGGKWESSQYQYATVTGISNYPGHFKSGIGLFQIGYGYPFTERIRLEIGAGIYAEQFRQIETRPERTNTSYPGAASAFASWAIFPALTLKTGVLYFAKGEQKWEQQFIPARVFSTFSVELYLWRN